MRTRFDQFAKQMMGAAFAAAGAVRTDEEVSPDVGHIDIWFMPHGAALTDAHEQPREVETALDSLGMLGRIGRAPCTMEPFHRTPDGKEVMDCVCKHHHFRNLLSRRDPKVPLPVQWIVSAGRPLSALAGLRFGDDLAELWGPGVYDGPALIHTRLLVVAELPETRDTLLLRLMGAGQVLARALADLGALPEDAPERVLALPLLVRLRIEIPAEAAKRTEDEEEYIMAMQSTLETYIAQWKDEAHREDLLEVYVARFGTVPDDVAAIIGRTTDKALLKSWLKVVARGSAEEVAAAIRARANG